MAGQVLGALNQDPNDLNEDQEFAPIQDNKPYGDISNSSTSPGSVNFLRNSEENPGFRFNKDGDKAGGSSPGAADSSGGRSESPADLKKSEENPGSGEKEKEQPASQGFMGNNFDKYNSTKKKVRGIRGRLSRNKWLVGVGVGGGGVFMIILILVLIGGAYKLVDFGEHIAAYQFARTASLGDEATTNIDNEALALDTINTETEAGSGLINALQEKYTAAAGQASDLWSKFDNYRPDKVIQNFSEKNIMNFNTSQTATGREYISSVTFKGVEGDFVTNSGSFSTSLKNAFIPGYKFYNDVQYAKDFAPQLTQTLKGGDIGIITRAGVASEIRDKLGIGTVAWIVGKTIGPSTGDPQTDADDALALQAKAAADGVPQSTVAADNGNVPATSPATNPNEPSEVTNASTDVSNQEAADLTTAGGIKDEVTAATNSTLSPEVAAKEADDISSTGLSAVFNSALSFVDPLYKIATPFCLIWDGSIVNSAPSMDSNTAQTERTGVYVQTAEAQLKDGYTATGEIDGAWNNKLGDIDSSYAEDAASGAPFDTSGYQSTEEAPIGQYSTNLGDYLGNGVGSVLGSVGQDVCPALTSLWTGIGLGAVALVTGVGGKLADLGASGLTESVANASMSDVIKAIGSKIWSAKDASTEFAGTVVKTGILVGGATFIAKQLVSQESGLSHSGLATGTNYDNDAFCGTNVYANQIDQEQYYGAPLQDQELEADSENSQAQLASANSSTGAFNRYFALSNPGSLLSHLALEANSISSTSSIGSFIHLGSTYISDPGGSLSSLIRPILGIGFAKAPATSVNTYCGNVQFGYTAAEKALLDECPSDTHDPKLCTYQPLENQLILDQSGYENSIASTYGKCFDGSVQIGDMLAQGLIVRDQSGDIVPDKGLCSPDNLGLHNTDVADGACGTNQGCGDLVFRYRVANLYNNTMDQLTCEQTTTPCDPSTGTAEQD